jgi:hypothetical protein
MALTDEERLTIIEEERVRWETRRMLMQDAWAQGGHGPWSHRRRGGRLLLWLPVLALLAWAAGRTFCHL